MDGTALGSLEATLRADGSDAGRLTLAGFDRLCDGEVDDALLASESAVTMNANLWSAHLISGVARNQRGETELAERHFQEALRMAPASLHHKASLERMLAAASPRRSAAAGGGHFAQFTPATWAAVVGIPALLLGIYWVSSSTHTDGKTTRIRPTYSASTPPAGASESPTAQPGASSMPAPQPYTPYVPYTPPASPYPSPMASASQPSAPPPITHDDAGYRPMGAGGDRPGSLPRASSSPMLPLEPAKPEIGNHPELRLRKPGSVTELGMASTKPNLTPWTTGGPRDRSSQRAVTFGSNGVGLARVGDEPQSTNSRPNLPRPSDSVVTSQRVRPSPAPPRPVEVREEEPAKQSGRDLQGEARRLERMGKRDEAAQTHRAAIEAYQNEIAGSKNPRAAEYGIAASRAAIDLIETPN